MLAMNNETIPSKKSKERKIKHTKNVKKNVDGTDQGDSFCGLVK